MTADLREVTRRTGAEARLRRRRRAGAAFPDPRMPLPPSVDEDARAGGRLRTTRVVPVATEKQQRQRTAILISWDAIRDGPDSRAPPFATRSGSWGHRTPLRPQSCVRRDVCALRPPDVALTRGPRRSPLDQARVVIERRFDPADVCALRPAPMWRRQDGRATAAQGIAGARRPLQADASYFNAQDA
jgi:hypothetical protein